MKIIVSTKGRITLPAEIRQRDRIEPGQEFEVERIGRGEYLLRRQEPRRNEDLVELLLACPVKGWFKRFQESGSQDPAALLHEVRSGGKLGRRDASVKVSRLMKTKLRAQRPD